MLAPKVFFFDELIFYRYLNLFKRYLFSEKTKLRIVNMKPIIDEIKQKGKVKVLFNTTKQSVFHEMELFLIDKTKPRDLYFKNVKIIHLLFSIDSVEQLIMYLDGIEPTRLELYSFLNETDTITVPEFTIRYFQKDEQYHYTYLGNSIPRSYIHYYLDGVGGFLTNRYHPFMNALV
jgi:hypothetical protein